METEVVNYIKQAEEYGLSEMEIKKNLLDAGWEASAVEESFEHAKAQQDQDKPAENPNLGKSTFVVMQSSRPQGLGLKPLGSQPSLAQMPPRTFPKAEETTPAPGPAATSSDAGFAKAGIDRKKLFLISGAALAVIILGIGGYLYFAAAQNTPQKIWAKFLSNLAATTFQNKMTLKYADGPNTTVTFENQAYQDLSNQSNPQSSSNVNLTVSSGGSTFAQAFNVIVKDQIIYFDLGDIPALADLLSKSSGQAVAKWIKVDLKTLSSQLGSMGISAQPDSAASTQLSRGLKDIWDQNPVVQMGSYAGTENLNGIKTMHFKNQLDKATLKDNLSKSLSLIANSASSFASSTVSGSVLQEGNQYATLFLNQLIDKLQVKTFETWIGIKDFRLYKISFAMSAPSFASLQNPQLADLVPGIVPAKAKSRDAKRFADVRQIATALELYYNDSGGYPASKNGQPLNSVMPYFVWPTAPAPSDGTCTDYYNTYWYTAKGGAKQINGKTVYDNYSLTFCLGQTVSAYPPGIAMLTPAGIQGNIPCPETDASLCSKPAPSQNLSATDQISQLVDKIDYSAEIDFDSEYSNYGKKQDIQPPADAVDIFQQLKAAQMPLPSSSGSQPKTSNFQ